jgi:hypothetical protein
MNGDRIDFISAYCDRWCERCAYTSRCSAFAVEAAIAMCGDIREGFELAIGDPRPVGGESAASAIPEWLAPLENVEMTAEEHAALDRQEEERATRIAATPIMKNAHAYSRLSWECLMALGENVITDTDDVVNEALEIVRHDETLIGAKLNRALDGRDRHSHVDEDDWHPIQNDWNGSAKVALISLERSEASWRVIGNATGTETPAILADQLHDLRNQVEEEFPHAGLFVRPGFDEPSR